jgi:hypothetical protein
LSERAPPSPPSVSHRVTAVLARPAHGCASPRSSLLGRYATHQRPLHCHGRRASLTAWDVATLCPCTCMCVPSLTTSADALCGLFGAGAAGRGGHQQAHCPVQAARAPAACAGGAQGVLVDDRRDQASAGTREGGRRSRAGCQYGASMLMPSHDRRLCHPVLTAKNARAACVGMPQPLRGVRRQDARRHGHQRTGAAPSGGAARTADQARCGSIIHSAERALCGEEVRAWCALLAARALMTEASFDPGVAACEGGNLSLSLHVSVGQERGGVKRVCW